jgi:hypothetical protein
VILAIVAAALIRSLDIWRDWKAEVGDPRFAIRSYWPWGLTSWRGVRRLAIPTEVALLSLLGVLLPSQLRLIPEVIFFFVAVPLGLSIFFLNRPKFAVPPALRKEDGVLTAMSRRRADR